MKYKPELGFFGNLERAFSELTKTNNQIFNNKTEIENKLNDSLALADETAIELFEAQMMQEEINAMHDDALIELYEMLEGE